MIWSRLLIRLKKAVPWRLVGKQEKRRLAERRGYTVTMRGLASRPRARSENPGTACAGQRDALRERSRTSSWRPLEQHAAVCECGHSEPAHLGSRQPSWREDGNHS